MDDGGGKTADRPGRHLPSSPRPADQAAEQLKAPPAELMGRERRRNQTGTLRLLHLSIM